MPLGNFSHDVQKKYFEENRNPFERIDMYTYLSVCMRETDKNYGCNKFVRSGVRR